jgi:hypothetical protein
MLPPPLGELLKSDVQKFIKSANVCDLPKLSLKYKTRFNLPFKAIAQQIAGREKTKDRMPLWSNTANILYPQTINLEQCSSEATANFKASWVQSTISDKKLLVDLTGGFGVDTFFLSKLFAQTIHLEPDATLSAIAHHNHHILRATSIVHLQQTAEQFLVDWQKPVSLFTIDPSRRNESKKVFKLADCQPNVVEIQDKLFAHAPFIMIKASPLLDIQQALRELKHVAKIAVVAVNNECKELLFLQANGFSDEPTVQAINLRSDGSLEDEFTFSLSDEKKSTPAISSPIQYLYEPNAAILKAGAFKLVAAKFKLAKLHPHTHLYTSTILTSEFPGRIFKIIALNPNSSQLQTLLPTGKANVVTRNYPLAPEELKKKLKLKDGGENYVIGFSEEKRKTIVIATRIK